MNETLLKTKKPAEARPVTYFNSSANDPLDGLNLDQVFCIDGAYNIMTYAELLEWKRKRGLI